MGPESSNGFERNKATLLGGPYGRCRGFSRDSFIGPSFPGSGVTACKKNPKISY